LVFIHAVELSDITLTLASVPVIAVEQTLYLNANAKCCPELFAGLDQPQPLQIGQRAGRCGHWLQRDKVFAFWPFGANTCASAIARTRRGSERTAR
jgi:hypothetical protein